MKSPGTSSRRVRGRRAAQRPSSSRFLACRHVAPLVGALLLLALIATSLAGAEETNPAAYVAAVEPICKSNAAANERILGGVKKQVQRGQLKPAAARFAKAASALRETLGQLRAVPQPPEDQQGLSKWFGYIKHEAELFGLVAKKLRAGQKGAASSLVIKLNNNATLANNSVLDFDFHYCRFEPSRYS